MTDEFLVTSAVLTHPGRKRRNNEDFVVFYEPDKPEVLQASGRLYIVADGVGGAAKGEQASQYAAQQVRFQFYNDPDSDVGERLRRALRKAGNDVYNHVQESEQFTKMATTMVAAVVRNNQLTVANVGDSRAYLVRGGKAQQITRDHTVAGEMLRNGEITEDEAMHVKGKNRLTRSIGGERDVHVDIFEDIQLQPGDRILLCSDGLTRYTLSGDIAALTSEGAPKEVVRRCIDFANKSGGADNIAAALVQIGEPVPVAAMALEPKGEVPEPVDWDALETVPSVRTLKPSKRKSPTRAHWVLLALLAAIPIGVGLYILVDSMLETGEGETPPLATQPFQISVPTDLPETQDPGQGIVEPTATPTPTMTPTPTPTATPTPTPTPDPFALFESGVLEPEDAAEQIVHTIPFHEEDFDAVGYWDLNETGNEIEGGKFIALDMSKDIGFTWSADKSLLVSDFYVEVSATFGEACKVSDHYGIVVRVDETSFMGYGLEFSCDGRYRVEKFMGLFPTPDELIGWTNSDAIRAGPGTTNAMGILALGSELHFYANGQHLSTVVDEGYSSGNFALFAHSLNTYELLAFFDDLKVWVPSPPP
ncbi:MAG: protein phosphatase 2C domain-containing protein [Anaerolineales bacterium]|jgi:protein phosphatase